MDEQLDCVPTMVDDQMNGMLTRCITNEEVRVVVFLLGGDKAPGSGTRWIHRRILSSLLGGARGRRVPSGEVFL